MVVLVFKDNEFNQADDNTESDILLKIDETQQKMILHVSPECGFVNRRTAERQARGIQKTGFLTGENHRVGAGYELVVEGNGGEVPDRLTQSPRQVY